MQHMQAANLPPYRLSGFGVFTAASYAKIRSMATRIPRIPTAAVDAGPGARVSCALLPEQQATA